MTTAVDRFEPQILRASAGTGKTYQLSSRLIALLAAGQSAESVLATTFTRKAAGEIHDRVVRRLTEAATDPRKLEEVSRAIAPVRITRERAVEVLRELLRSLHRQRICTLDSFFAAVAGSFGLELGLPPGWRIVDEVEDRRIRGEAIRAVLDVDDPQRLVSLIRLLNPGEVRRAVHEQVRNVVDRLYAVFTDQSSAAAWSAFRAPPRMETHEVHRILESLEGIERHVPRNRDGSLPKKWVAALRANIEAARRGDWLAFVGGGIAAKLFTDDESFDRKPIPPEVRTMLAPLCDQARGELLWRVQEQTRATFELLREFDRQYRRLKRAAKAMRFDDITHQLAAASLTGRLDEVYYRLDGWVKHLLLDEFQDTSPDQWRVIEPIADEVISHGGVGRAFFCVGDLKQAIYGWRGGEAAIFGAMEKRWPHITPISTEQTRRCSEAVVEAVNDVFTSLGRREGPASGPAAAAEWAAGFAPHTTLSGRKGYTELRTAPRAGEGQKQAHATLAHAAQLVKEIQGRAPQATVGVLTRSNAAVARVIYELRRMGIVASEEGGNPLTDSPAVSAVMSLLRLADHPGDSAARYHVARSPLGEVVGLTDFRDGERAAELATGVRRRLMAEGYGATLGGWAKSLAGACDRRDLNRLLQLAELGHQYDPRATLRTLDFVEFVESQRVADPTASPVRVMTVHQSKGLEFDVVVLPELDKLMARGGGELVLMDRPGPVSPAQMIVRYCGAEYRQLDARLEAMAQQATAAKVREALCVLYVAMTRAKSALYMVIDPPRENEKTLPATYAGLLRGALVEEKAEGPVFYRRGRERWESEIRGVAEAAVAECGCDVEPDVVMATMSGRRRNLPRRSPSAEEGGTRVNLADRLRLEPSVALDRGAAIHRLFQQVRWLDDGVEDHELRRVVEGEREAAGYLEQFGQMVKQEAVRGALSAGSYPKGATLTVWRERPFAVEMDGAVLSGVFDRVVIVGDVSNPDAAEVLDYKTDRDEGRVEFYRPQLQQYRRALAKMLRLDEKRIAAKLLFVSTGRIVAV